MQNDQQNPNNPPTYTPQQDTGTPVPAPTTPQAHYPTPTSGPVAEHSTPPLPNTQFAAQQPVQDKYNTWSLVIFGLLLLTFFSPLGSVLFLPIVLVGFFGAVSQAHKSTKQSYSGYEQESLPKSLAYTLLKALIIIGAVIGLCILGIIGFFFIVLSSGGGRMGS